jgi:hypothetical protein
MLESAIENYLREKVKAIGGKAYKFVSPGNVGVPDRIVILPGGKIIFVETKAPGKKPTPLQRKRIAELIGLGCDAFVIDSKEGVEGLLRIARSDIR